MKDLPDDTHAELLLDLYMEATHRPKDPYAVIWAIRRRLESNANEHRILEHLYELEVARLYDLRDPASGERLLLMKNIASALGVSIGQVSKLKKRASPDALVGIVSDETRRLSLVADNPNVPDDIRLKAHRRATVLSRALQRLLGRAAGAAA
ncbi:hypothetical protein ACGFJC_46990, partial [Nonomuraea fuscirosea]|uniref:hypothetical protein n=1 Tax=Nonomuraea fuscirosea TaxID=1291556 RepID=UPI0037132021